MTHLWNAIHAAGPDGPVILLGSADTAHAAQQLCERDAGRALTFKGHPHGWSIADHDQPAAWVVEQRAADDPWIASLERAA